jgi:hypothetical protein
MVASGANESSASRRDVIVVMKKTPPIKPVVAHRT